MPVGVSAGIGRRCGPHVGEAQRHWRWFRAPARCRSETGAPLSPAVRVSGVGAESGVAHGMGVRHPPACGGLCRSEDRRSLPCAPSCPRGYAPRRGPLHGLAVRVSRPCGVRCRSGSAPGLEGGAALTSARRSVIGAGFALPRDAGRRPPPGELAGAPLSRAVSVRGVGAESGAPCRGWGLRHPPARGGLCRSEGPHREN